MKKSRRSFLKAAGVSAVAIGAAPAIKAVAVASGGAATNASAAVKSRKTEALSAHRWGMVIDTSKITEEVAEAVVEACRKAHNIPDFNHEPDQEKYPDTRPVDHKQEIKWIWEEHYQHAFPEMEDEFLAEKFRQLPFLVTCNHCKNAPCVQACPTKATFKREDGIVLMDFHRCIGCRFCMAACPFGSRSFNFRDPRPFISEFNPDFPTRSKGVVEKCNLCAERLAKGLQPACVEASEGAIVVGDLEDPESEVRALLNENYAIRRKQELGTEPSVYYVM
ncbi:HmeE2 [Desulfamplus magnetovallimortis]|uniref:HmeE2 n=1 Tax=Desulfamplus magnetovallimortis TaxID=1246637 RepID=A0A1W1HCI5_9BACT|nr:4Fe-4S dicluster domain-containing protein [Desulfamplus magnetovallimortis]SLM30169.1 HmeE2 [Desulfamplus magnetovallimortis]